MDDAINLADGKICLPRGLGYTEDHLWIQEISSCTYRIGLTQPKVLGRGQILYLEFCVAPGDVVRKGDSLLEVESQKSIIAMASPLDGTILQINKGLQENLDRLRAQTYDEGWLVEIESPADNPIRNAFMTADQYCLLAIDELGGRLGL